MMKVKRAQTIRVSVKRTHKLPTRQQHSQMKAKSIRIVPVNTRPVDAKTSSVHRKIPSQMNETSIQQKRNTNKKNICSCWCTIIVIANVLLMSVILTIILLLALLHKPKPTITRTAVLRWNTNAITIAGTSGSPGNRSDQLNAPYSAILDYQHSLYVADRNNHRIQKFSMGSSTAMTVAGNGTLGSAMTQLNLPAYAIADLNGNVRVVDTFNHRIQLWKNGASSGTTIAGIGMALFVKHVSTLSVLGGLGNSSNQLNEPYAIYYYMDSDLLQVSDYGNCRIMQYSSGATSGTIIAGGNQCGIGVTQLYCPMGIVLDSFSHSFIIANQFAHNIVRWPVNGTSWKIVAGDTNGNYGANSTMLKNPRHVTLDPMGNIYVADKDNYRVQLFMNGTKEGITIAGISGVSGGNSILLDVPRTVELDNQLNLYVADSANHRVQKFLRY